MPSPESHHEHDVHFQPGELEMAEAERELEKSLTQNVASSLHRLRSLHSVILHKATGSSEPPEPAAEEQAFQQAIQGLDWDHDDAPEVNPVGAQDAPTLPSDMEFAHVSGSLALYEKDLLGDYDVDLETGELFSHQQRYTDDRGAERVKVSRFVPDLSEGVIREQSVDVPPRELKRTLAQLPDTSGRSISSAQAIQIETALTNYQHQVEQLANLESPEILAALEI